MKLTAKTVDEDPAGYKRWISRKRSNPLKYYEPKNEKSKDYCKVDRNLFCFVYFERTSRCFIW